MQGKFEIYEVRVGMQELTPIDDYAIKTILESYKDRDSIIRIFAIGNFPFASSFPLKDKLNYNKSLADQVGKILGVTVILSPSVTAYFSLSNFISATSIFLSSAIYFFYTYPQGAFRILI